MTRPVRVWRRLEWPVVVLMVMLTVVGGGALVTLPDAAFHQNVVVDDAFYYSVPARHFVEGHGFSFDGVYSTSGVQTLWALVTTCLAWLIPGDEILVRAMCGSPGCYG